MIAPLALGLLAVLSPLVTAPHQASAGPCTGTEGVTVVVDFQELGGGVNVVCARGQVASGLEALERAGVSYHTAQRFPGFVCRIAGQPANDPCVNTSPASAYWGYWLAAPGGAWCYSTIGAGTRRPPPGTFEGWSFSLDKAAAAIPPPRFAPPAATSAPPATLNRSDCVSVPAPPVATTATVPSTTAATTAATTTAATSTAPTPATTVVPTDATTATTATLTSAAAATPPTTGTAPTSTTPTTSADLGEDGSDGGSAIGFVVAATAIVAAGTAAVVMARRRRVRP